MQCWGASRTRVGNHCLNILFVDLTLIDGLKQGCQTQFLEGRSPAEFSFNPN